MTPFDPKLEDDTSIPTAEINSGTSTATLTPEPATPPSQPPQKPPTNLTPEPPELTPFQIHQADQMMEPHLKVKTEIPSGIAKDLGLKSDSDQK